METLEELKEKFSKLDKERGILFKRILELEDQETLKKFTVGNCYLDICKNHLTKVIAIDNDELCAIIIDELLKDMFHSASEVPRNDNGKVLAFSKEIGNSKLYDTEVMLDEIYYFSWQDIWEKEVKKYNWSNWLFVEDLLDLITKGGNHD